MWADVQNELTEILSSRLFPVLASDPGYRVMLRNAGLTSIPDYKGGRVDPEFDTAQRNWGSSMPMKTPMNIRSPTEVLPPAVRLRLETAARMCAQLIVMKVDADGSLRERRAKAVILEGPTTLFRLWDSGKDNRTRHWWFSEHLLNLAEAQREQSPRDWLRDRLAVSFNFSKCDRISELTLGVRTGIPAVEAWGLPMPQYSPNASDARSNDNREACQDHSDKAGAIFQGQKTQYFLPFVPPDRIKDADWL
jgi:hypothetical protein